MPDFVWQRVFSAALEPGHVLIRRAGRIRGATAQIAAAAPAGTYYVQFWTGGAFPLTSGARLFDEPIAVNHTAAADDLLPPIWWPDDGADAPQGLVAALSTTRYTFTAPAGSYLAISAEVTPT
jgi:hypothetical protein